MSKTELEKSMETLFNVAPAKPIIDVIKESKEVEVLSPEEGYNSDEEEDFELARKSLKTGIEITSDAIEELHGLAESSESPRAYEVLANLIKTNIDASKELLNLRKIKKDLKGETRGSGSASGSITNNAIYVGSTSELMQLIKSNQ